MARLSKQLADAKAARGEKGQGTACLALTGREAAAQRGDEETAQLRREPGGRHARQSDRRTLLVGSFFSLLAEPCLPRLLERREERAAFAAQQARVACCAGARGGSGAGCNVVCMQCMHAMHAVGGPEARASMSKTLRGLCYLHAIFCDSKRSSAHDPTVFPLGSAVFCSSSEWMAVATLDGK